MATTKGGQRPVIAMLMGAFLASACAPTETAFDGFGAHKLRVVNRQATRLEDRNGARLSSLSGNGVAWVEGSDFKTGTIEIDVRGREDLGQTYEAVYLRPFNFHAQDPTRRQHAVQYVKLPEFDFQDLRDQFPEEFENPVAAWIEPADWIRLRVVVSDRTVQIHVGSAGQPALEVRKLGDLDGGQVGR